MEATTEQPNKYATNHRPAKLYDFRGGKATISTIARETGLSFSSIWRRAERGEKLDLPPMRPGRKPNTVTMTTDELAAILEITPGAVSKRIERGQDLEKPRRYGLVRDVTEEPKRKPAESIDVNKDRAEVVADLLRRLNEYRAVETPESALVQAYNAGLLAGSKGERDEHDV